MARQRAEIEALAYQSLLVVGLSRMDKRKRLPSLQSLIGEDKPKTAQSADEMASNCRAWGLVLKSQAGEG